MGPFARRLYEPCAEILRFMRESGDPELISRYKEIDAGRLQILAALGPQLEATGRLQPGMSGQAAGDLVWSMSAPTTYEQLVLDRGWTPERFEAGWGRRSWTSSWPTDNLGTVRGSRLFQHLWHQARFCAPGAKTMPPMPRGRETGIANSHLDKLDSVRPRRFDSERLVRVAPTRRKWLLTGANRHPAIVSGPEGTLLEPTGQ
jgi:hypothetical protein